MVYFLTGSCMRKRRLSKTESDTVKKLRRKGVEAVHERRAVRV